MKDIYKKVLNFKRKYPLTVAWRLRKHSKVVVEHLNNDEEVIYAFTGQYNGTSYEVFHSAVFVITNKRLLIGVKRALVGYFFYSITPDMFNDLTIISGIIWGKLIIDTVKEVVTISNLDKKSLKELEDYITKYIMEEKQKYLRNESANLKK